MTEAKNSRDPELAAIILKRAEITDFSGIVGRFSEERLPELREATRKELRRVVDKELLPVFDPRDPNSILPEEVDSWPEASRSARPTSPPVRSRTCG